MASTPPRGAMEVSSTTLRGAMEPGLATRRAARPGAAGGCATAACQCRKVKIFEQVGEVLNVWNWCHELFMPVVPNKQAPWTGAETQLDLLLVFAYKDLKDLMKN